MEFDGRFGDRLRSDKYAMIKIAFNENHEMSSTHFRLNACDPCESADLVSLNFTVLTLR